MASIFGISEDAPLETLSEEQVTKLWNEAIRNQNSDYVTALRTGTHIPTGECERRHVQLREEMRRRDLPF